MDFTFYVFPEFCNTSLCKTCQNAGSLCPTFFRDLRIVILPLHGKLWVTKNPYSNIFCAMCDFMLTLLDSHFGWFFKALIYENYTLTVLTIGFFRAAHGWGVFCAPSPLPKIRHRYPTMMKLGTVIPYLRKIQKIHKSHDTSLEFCLHQHFFTGNPQILLHQEIHK